MNELLDKILDRPKAQKIGILAFVIVLFLAGYYSNFYAKRADEISRLADDMEAARAEKNKKQQLAANLPKLQLELRDLDAMLKQAIAQLPSKKEIPDLLSSISNKAQEAGLEVSLFRPRAESYRDFYAEIPVDIVIKGSFPNVVAFFDDVGRLDRLVNINNIGFKNAKVTGEQVVVEASSLATAFRFLDDTERKKIAEEKAKAAKEKK